MTGRMSDGMTAAITAFQIYNWMCHPHPSSGGVSLVPVRCFFMPQVEHTVTRPFNFFFLYYLHSYLIHVLIHSLLLILRLFASSCCCCLWNMLFPNHLQLSVWTWFPLSTDLLTIRLNYLNEQLPWPTYGKYPSVETSLNTTNVTNYSSTLTYSTTLTRFLRMSSRQHHHRQVTTRGLIALDVLAFSIYLVKM